MKRILFVLLLTLLAGCASEQPTGEELAELLTGTLDQRYEYVLDGEQGFVGMRLYSGVNNYTSGLPRTYTCPPDCLSNEDIQRRYVENQIQDLELKKLAISIKTRTQRREDQARIAISLVQNIPYDEESYASREHKDRYPYQVLYENMGVCGEKTRLLAYLLKELGYETALLRFPAEEHSALGIKCPAEHTYKGTGYCFIETSSPAIPTYSEGEYPGFGYLRSQPEVIRLSRGDEYRDFGQEAGDAKEMERIKAAIASGGGVLSERDYQIWAELSSRYGLRTG